MVSSRRLSAAAELVRVGARLAGDPVLLGAIFAACRLHLSVTVFRRYLEEGMVGSESLARRTVFRRYLSFLWCFVFRRWVGPWARRRTPKNFWREVLCEKCSVLALPRRAAMRILWLGVRCVWWRCGWRWCVLWCCVCVVWWSWWFLSGRICMCCMLMVSFS